MVVDTIVRLDNKPKPPIKWAGGKSQLLTQLRPLFPPEFSRYSEPFVGGGAVFFDLQPTEAVLIDSNFELINFYQVIKQDLDALLDDLRKHQNKEDYYYYLRALDPAQMDSVARASRFLFLNKTGYNGLWRVNRQGRHNVPYGKYKNPQFLDEDNLRQVSQALNSARLVWGDFSEVLKYAVRGTFVYFDPPYHPLTRTANFTSYTSDAFDEKDQYRLAEVFRKLDALGCYVMLSNSATDFIREIYRGYDFKTVYARRTINCRSDRRGPITELVIRNYS